MRAWNTYIRAREAQLGMPLLDERKDFNRCLKAGGTEPPPVLVGSIMTCVDPHAIGSVEVSPYMHEDGTRWTQWRVVGQDPKFPNLGHPHGMHLHRGGDVRAEMYGGDAPCQGVCDHYDEGGTHDHGSLTSATRHAGDFGNIHVGKNGEFSCMFEASLCTTKIAGRALVLHTDEDDLGQGQNTESKKTGNAGKRWAYAVLGRACAFPPLCLTCVAPSGSRNAVISQVQGTADWIKQTPKLEHAGPSQVPESAFPDGADMQLTFTVPNHRFFSGDLVWWAARPLSFSESVRRGKVGPPLDAYTTGSGPYTWPNSGRCTVNSEQSTLTIQFKSPRPYVEKGVLWPRHCHFAKITEGSPNPSLGVYTVAAFPSKHRQDGFSCHSIGEHSACCLGKEELFAALQDDAMNTKFWHIDATGADRELGQRIHFINLAQSSSRAEIKRKCAPIGSSPVVVYCAHKECNAASKLIEKMMMLGVGCNVFYYPTGYAPK